MVNTNSKCMTIRTLQNQDIVSIAAAFQSLRWNKPQSQYQRYLQEQGL